MKNGSGNTLSANVFRIYYAATAVFLVLDYVFGINIRLASLEALPGWRAFYYFLCFGCLGLLLWRPAWSLWVTTTESLITLSMLIISMGVRVFTVSDTMLSSGSGLITTEEIINFVIAGGAAWIAYTRGSLEIQRELKQR